MLETLHDIFLHPAGMLAAILLLLLYHSFSRRMKYLPHIPVGLLSLYFLIRIGRTFILNLDLVEEGEKWINLASSIILAWALIKLIFSIGVDYALKLFHKQPLPKITKDLILLLAYIVVSLIFLRAQGDVNLAGLITTSAVLTAVIGLAAQSTLSSLFSGITLQMERPFNIGDWISYKEYIGRVQGITWKTTRLITREDETIYIPNTEVSTATFKNFSRPSPRHVAKLEVGIEYDAPPNEIRRTILNVLDVHLDVLKEPPPEVRLKTFGDFAIIYEAIFWHRDYADEPRLKADLNNQLWYALRRADIKIPFPIRDISLHHIERRHRAKKDEAMRKEIADRLINVPIFTSLSPEHRTTIAAALAIEAYGQGEVIVRQGDPGDSLYIIHQGSCEVLLGVESHKSRVVATMKEGEFFGEMSLLTGEPRSATVRAKSDVVVHAITKETVSTLLKENPETSSLLAEALAQRQTELSDVRHEVSAEASRKFLSRIKSFFGIR